MPTFRRLLIKGTLIRLQSVVDLSPENADNVIKVAHFDIVPMYPNFATIIVVRFTLLTQPTLSFVVVH